MTRPWHRPTPFGMAGGASRRLLVGAGFVAALTVPLTGLPGLLVAAALAAVVWATGLRLVGALLLVLALSVLVMYLVVTGALGGRLTGDVSVSPISS